MPPPVLERGQETIASRACLATAFFSACRTYRYHLTREWSEQRPRALFVMLNPSTADAMKLDPTIRRCVGYAMAWGYGSVAVANLFAFRATDPEDLRRSPQPIGERDENDQEVNDLAIIDAAETAHLIVCAWGAHPLALKRGREVTAMLLGRGHCLACLTWSKERHPVHPLYQKADLRPRIFASLDPADLAREGGYLDTPATAVVQSNLFAEGV